MSATHVIRQLLEEQDDPADFGALEPYLGPIEFDNNIKDILDQARFLKQQAEEAGALNWLLHSNSSGRPPSPADIDRAFLIIAIEHFQKELKMPSVYAQRLKREMHSIWT